MSNRQLNSDYLFSFVASPVSEGDNSLVLRSLHIDDYSKGLLFRVISIKSSWPLTTSTETSIGVCELLEQLTVVGEVSIQKFQSQFEQMKRTGDYYVIVIEDLNVNRIIAMGTILVEYKFLRGCGKVRLIYTFITTYDKSGLEIYWWWSH